MMKDCFQVWSEWQRVGETQGVVLFHHRHSREASEQRLLVGAPMRQLEHFTGREAYSFPACPRIHKCAIVANYCTGNDYRVDLAVLVECLPFNLALTSPSQRKEVIKKLGRQLTPLVGGFEYLYRRYGPFLITEQLVSWNSYGMVRVWLNSNTLKHHPEQHAENEEQMVASILKLLEISLEIRFRDKIKSFQELQQRIENEDYCRSEGTRRVKFEEKQEKRLWQFLKERNRQQSSAKTSHHAHSNVSIGSKPSGKQLAASFQFDSHRKNRLRSRLSSQKQKEGNRNQADDKSCGSQGIPQKVQRPQGEQEEKGKEGEEEKENVEPLKRKESKAQTCIIDTHSPSHPRRYSKPNTLFRTQECFGAKRKSSLLRQELLQDFDGLFRSDSEMSFDSSELEKELQSVL